MALFRPEVYSRDMVAAGRIKTPPLRGSSVPVTFHYEFLQQMDNVGGEINLFGYMFISLTSGRGPTATAKRVLGVSWLNQHVLEK